VLDHVKAGHNIEPVHGVRSITSRKTAPSPDAAAFRIRPTPKYQTTRALAVEIAARNSISDSFRRVSSAESDRAAISVEQRKPVLLPRAVDIESLAASRTFAPCLQTIAFQSASADGGYRHNETHT
jgi:hypothetical protein